MTEVPLKSIFDPQQHSQRHLQREFTALNRQLEEEEEEEKETYYDKETTS